MASNCIIWPLRPNKINGYGYKKVNGKSWLAHRLVFTQARGEIPQGMDVLHKCDVPNCVNLDHLYLGDHAINMEDMKNKGRARSLMGENANGARLNVQDVLYIRSSKLSTLKLLRKFNMSPYAIWAIKHRRTWYWLPDQLTRRIYRG